MDEIECKRCGDVINAREKHATFQGISWHQDCFHCFKCSSDLDNTLFTVSEDEELLCYGCYDSEHVFLCYQCNEPIKLGEEKFMMGELFWHRSCFQCKSCEATLNPNLFWLHDDLYYCKGCYGERFTETCQNCDQKIMKDGIKYRDKDYHSKCFICGFCNINLIKKRFFFRDDLVYCQECFVEKFSDPCHSCKEMIKSFDGETKMSSGDLHWHEKCFLCKSCQQSLVGLSFALKESTILCPGCAKTK